VGKKKGKLPPIELWDEDHTTTAQAVRRRAIERQTVSGEGQEAEHWAGESGGRRIYPSDLERRQRTVTITLPDQASMDYLKGEADRLSAQGEDEITPTRLATLILVAGIQQWRQGKLHLTTETAAVETLVIRPSEEAGGP
jgi:hypothetical protein